MVPKDIALIFDPKYQLRFIQNFTHQHILFTGDFYGDITNFANKLPALKGKKLFYFYPTNQYVILQKYSTNIHIIEMIKRIYSIPMIPYNLCVYKKKYYIMYQYIPFVECEYSPNRKKNCNIQDMERIIYLLYWMLGIKGKVSKVISEHEDIILSK
jgi:hypothetical protein